MTTTMFIRLRLPAAGLCLLAAACGGSTATSTAHPSGPASAATGTAPTTTATGASSQVPLPVESNPAGDIPDSVAFVSYRNAAGGYSFRYPEGWARADSGTAVSFTDKLNGIVADASGALTDPTVDTIRTVEVPRLQRTQPAFELKTVEPVTLPAGKAVRVVYRRNSAPDPVTGRRVRDEVESYVLAAGGRQLRLDLFGPVGADNVDAYRTISRSLALS